jgi:hypothetical protein
VPDDEDAVSLEESEGYSLSDPLLLSDRGDIDLGRRAQAPTSAYKDTA